MDAASPSDTHASQMNDFLPRTSLSDGFFNPQNPQSASSICTLRNRTILADGLCEAGCRAYPDFAEPRPACTDSESGLERAFVLLTRIGHARFELSNVENGKPVSPESAAPARTHDGRTTTSPPE